MWIFCRWFKDARLYDTLLIRLMLLNTMQKKRLVFRIRWTRSVHLSWRIPLVLHSSHWYLWRLLARYMMITNLLTNVQTTHPVPVWAANWNHTTGKSSLPHLPMTFIGKKTYLLFYMSYFMYHFLWNCIILRWILKNRCEDVNWIEFAWCMVHWKAVFECGDEPLSS